MEGPLQDLARGIDGKIFAHADISCWNQLLRGASSPLLQPAKPRCVVQVTSEQDVVKAVGFAVEHGLKVSAKGTGHQYGGAFLPEDGMLLDMAGLNQVSVNPVTRTATIGPGVTSRQLAEALLPHGLHFPLGHISHVGCSGFILGGGNGCGVTLYGGAVDNVESLRVVLPQESGVQVVEVDQESDPQLFAGLKGAGAFLGIVTEFKLRLHPIPAALPVVNAVYPASCAQQVAAALLKLLATGPASIEPALAFVCSPQAEPLVILATTAFAEASDTEVQAALDQVRQLEPGQRVALEDTVMPYLQALSQQDGAWSWPGLCCYAHGMFVEKEALTPDLVKRLSEVAAAMSSPKSILLVAPQAPPSSQPSSLSFRGGLFVSAYAMWPRTEAGPQGDGDALHKEWVKKVEAAVGDAAVGLYVNEVMFDQPGQVAKCYSKETFESLQQLKARCDPLGLLRSLS